MSFQISGKGGATIFDTNSPNILSNYNYTSIHMGSNDFNDAIKLNAALDEIMSAISLVAQTGKVNLSGRGGVKNIAQISIWKSTFISLSLLL